jgi:hypothetical protein
MYAHRLKMLSAHITLHSRQNDPPVDDGAAVIDITLTPEQIIEVQRHISQYRAADQDGRTIIIQDAVRRIERSCRPGEELNRGDLETVRSPLSCINRATLTQSKVVRRLLHVRGRRERKTFTFVKKWTYNDVLIDIHRKELDEMAAEMSQSKAGSAAYLGCYKKAVKTINEGLDEDTRVKYRAEAKKWSEQMPPPRKQQQYVHLDLSIKWEVTKSHL